MIQIFKKLLFVASLVTFGSHAAIIDNETELLYSFKDTDTGLVWMDFGVNNGESYNYVSGQLGNGGAYEGWRLPSIAEVYAMWANVADLDNVDADFENPYFNGIGQLYAYDSNSNVPLGDDSVWEAIFDIIGYNTTTTETFFTYNYALGWFQGTEGMSLVQYGDFKDSIADNYVYNDHMSLIDNFNFTPQFASEEIPSYATLLVRVNEVPEPSTIGLFALVLVGLAARRRRVM